MFTDQCSVFTVQCSLVNHFNIPGLCFYIIIMSDIKAPEDKRNIFGIEDINNNSEFQWIKLVSGQTKIDSIVFPCSI